MFNKREKELERKLDYALSGWANMFVRLDPITREGELRALEDLATRPKNHLESDVLWMQDLIKVVFGKVKKQIEEEKSPIDSYRQRTYVDRFNDQQILYSQHVNDLCNKWLKLNGKKPKKYPICSD